MTVYQHMLLAVVVTASFALGFLIQQTKVDTMTAERDYCITALESLR